MTDFDSILVPSAKGRSAIPISGVIGKKADDVLASLSDNARNWAKQNGFAGKKGQVLSVPGESGKVERILAGLGETLEDVDPFQAGALATSLPDGTYRLEEGFGDIKTAALSFLLGCYKFDSYTKPSRKKIRLVTPKGSDRAELLRLAEGVGLTRDLINIPANDMGPQELQKAAGVLAKKHGAKLKTVSGPQLKKNYPMVHAVGRASSRPPRLIDMTWGKARAPKITLVGKGVCFDTGGLDIKPSNAMLLMKKDMGGAANVLGLALMIMDAKLPIRLRVLIPAVENAVGSDAFRPGDILKSRSGLSVEIGNTDAEGRLVLADALALADEEEPELLVSMATLTGAARVALGPDLPPFYVEDGSIAHGILRAARRVNDPVWRMPLWKPYESMLKSTIADTNNVGGGGFAGSITAALFLQKFVKETNDYVHFDIYGWTPTAKPGRPVGGEAQGIRALFEYLSARFG